MILDVIVDYLGVFELGIIVIDGGKGDFIFNFSFFDVEVEIYIYCDEIILFCVYCLVSGIIIIIYIYVEEKICEVEKKGFVVVNY